MERREIHPGFQKSGPGAYRGVFPRGGGAGLNFDI